MARNGFKIADNEIAPGTRRTIDIPLGVFSNHAPMNLPVHVIHGFRAGPVLFVSAAVHGDEVLGVEIIRRLMKTPALRRLRGTLLLVPVVNSYGFISQTRYLPDRRDLNRSFPGGPSGSLAARLAHTFMTEIVYKSQVGVDLHTGSLHRVNLPQVRTDFDKGASLQLARAFAAPVVLNSNLRDGSLREAAQAAGVDVLIFEAGEALRFDEFAIRVGVKGVIHLMQHLDMLTRRSRKQRVTESVLSRSSHWLRSPVGGIFRVLKNIGERIEKNEKIGIIADPLGETEEFVISRSAGIIIGRTNLPVVNQGDALIHVAKVFDPESAEDRLEEHEQELAEDPLFDSSNHF